MNYYFKIMEQNTALIIANDWEYEGVYQFYNAKQDEEDYKELINADLRGENYYEAFNEKK